MEIVINAILVTVIIGICCNIIIKGIDRYLSNSLEKQIQLNKQLLGLYQNEKDKTDTLYKILQHIKSQLSLLGLSECPEEELKNIPFEIVGWIEQLMIEENRNNGVQK